MELLIIFRQGFKFIFIIMFSFIAMITTIIVIVEVIIRNFRILRHNFITNFIIIIDNLISQKVEVFFDNSREYAINYK